MGLIKRKPRPLIRDSASFRDDRLFIVACDDTYAPAQYFGFFRITRVKVHVVPTPDGTSSAPHVLDRLLAVDHDKDDELWMLLDTDHYTKASHVGTFSEAIRKAQRNGVKLALSKPCFELWLLLHHAENADVCALENATKTENALRKVLGQYNKKNLKQEHFPLASVFDACHRAESLDGTVKGGDIPESNTSRVFLLWKAIAAKALPSQLPSELRGLLP